jgi:hypothetical protein
MRAAAFSLCGVALLIAMSGTFGEAEAGDCGAAIEAAKAEWRSLTKGNHIVAPSTRIDTSDGRHLTGSLLNYSWILLARAANACDAAQDATAMDYLGEFERLLHPVPHQL